ncbi:hypothetical protein [Cedecea lapagei]|uniref:hypothetical protein n=1 Tax=Cedecea lapagei TaxID=158823 RepID=UPI001BCD046F|nr:hypothetical protein [Cedecea lapagei]
MSSIPARFLSKINTTEFNVGILSTDDSDRKTLASINVLDIDALIRNLEDTKTYIIEIQNNKQAQAKKLLEELVAGSSDFGSVEELLNAISSDDVPVHRPRTMTGTNNNRRYEVTLFDAAADKHVRFIVVNNMLPKALTDHPLYVEITKKNKELLDTDAFLRAYSTDYAEAFPINAKWNKKTFHLNARGRLNKSSAKYFEDFKKENPTADESEFKRIVTEAYSDPA